MHCPRGHWYLLVPSPGHIYHSSCPGVLMCIQRHKSCSLKCKKCARVTMGRVLSEVMKSCSGGSQGRICWICFNGAKTFPSDPVTLKSLYNQRSNNGTSRSCLFCLGLDVSFRSLWLQRLEFHWLPKVSRMALLRPHVSVFHQMSPTFGGKANIFRRIRGFKELRSNTF